MDPHFNWCVVQTQPHTESKAASHLVRQGFISYLPRYLKRRRHARRTELVAAPLFPRYMFVAVDIATQRWRAIQSTIGVASLVRNGDVPATVPLEVISELKLREDARGFIQFDTKPRFVAGDKVRVVDGVFIDCLGLFECCNDQDRVAILLDLLGRKVRVVIDGMSVAAA
jgi:transcriptional antiterminator RfaH